MLLCDRQKETADDWMNERSAQRASLAHLVCQHEEYTKLLEHGTLRDHFEMKDTTHCCPEVCEPEKRWTPGDLTSRVMAKPYPNAFSTSDRNKAATIRSIWVIADDGEKTRKKQNLSRTERNRTSYFARERAFVIPRRRLMARADRRYHERIDTQRLDLKDLVRLLNNFPQANRLFQFLLPFCSKLVGFGIHCIQASKPSVMVNSTREDRAGVGRGFRGSWGIGC
jgi:hypothetical protein